MSLELFTPYRGLYGPDSHPQLPWWRRVGTGKLSTTWRRGDGLWEVEQAASTTGDLSVRRLGISDDDPEAHRLREESGFSTYMVPGNVPRSVMVATIECIALSDRFDPMRHSSFSTGIPGGKVPTFPEIIQLASEKLLEIDRRYPVAEPQAWPGQYWQCQDGTKKFLECESAGNSEFNPRIALLYGPTPRGWGVPWLAPSLLPETLQ